MPPVQYHITQADADAAKYEMFHHPDPKVQQRMFCLRLRFCGYENEMIASTIEIHRNTVGNYLKIYKKAGLEGLRTLNYCGLTSKLDKHQVKLEASFRQSPPRTAKEATKRIKKLTGVKRSVGRVRAFLHRMGMKVRATGQIPAKADPKKQLKFHDEILQPLLEKAKLKQCHAPLARD